MERVYFLVLFIISPHVLAVPIRSPGRICCEVPRYKGYKATSDQQEIEAGKEFCSKGIVELKKKGHVKRMKCDTKTGEWRILSLPNDRSSDPPQLRLIGFDDTEKVKARDIEMHCTVQTPSPEQSKSLEFKFRWTKTENGIAKPIQQLESRKEALGGNGRFAYMKSRSTSILVIREVRMEYLGNYTCTVEVAGARISKSVELKGRNCHELSLPVDGTFSGVSSHVSSHPPGTELVPRCLPGFVMKEDLAYKLKCQVWGSFTIDGDHREDIREHWNRKMKSNICQQGCVKEKVGKNMTERIGRGSNYRMTNDVIPPRTKIIYTCHKDYELVGKRKRVCLPTGQYASERPTCILASCRSKLKCDGPIAISNGDFVVDPTSNETCNLRATCDDGYTLTGPRTITCQRDEKQSKWNWFDMEGNNDFEPPNCSKSH